MPDSRDQGIARLFADSRQALSRYVRRLVGSQSAADEIVQEAFLRVYNQPQAREPLRPYLFSVARNLASNSRRHDRIVNAFSAKDVASQLIEAEQSPEDSLLADERLRLLNESIRNLPPQCRAAFALRMFQDRSYKEIAAQLGISARTVEKHIAAAVSVIHADLAKRFQEGSAP